MIRLLTADCRSAMPHEGPFDLIIADPPYGDTSLPWDRIVPGWEAVARGCLKPTGSLWLFGSLRYFLRTGLPKGWQLAQDIVWEKHNGSSMAADRFKRVHEHAIQLYPKRAPWSQIYNDVQTTPDATAKVVRRKTRPSHWGGIGESVYVSEDGGPRIQRSVIPMPSPRSGLHRTEKPVGLLEILIRTSCPPGGVVGDFFAGSGAVGEACLTTGRCYVGCEADPVMAEKARDRLGQSLFAVGDASAARMLDATR